MRIILVKFEGLHYPLYHNYNLFSDHDAVFKPKHHISEVRVVILEYLHIEDNNNPVSGAK